MLPYSCLAFDLDHTLTRFNKPYETFFSLFSEAGIPLSQVRKTYEEMRHASFFTISGFIYKLMDETDIVLDVPKMYSGFDDWLKTSIELYDDVLPLFQQISLPTAIITLGEPLYQRKKCTLTGIQSTHFFTTEKSGTKAIALRQLLALYPAPLLYIDDSVSELNAIRDAEISESDVHLVLLDRKEKSHPPDNSRFNHRIMHSLQDLLLKS